MRIALRQLFLDFLSTIVFVALYAGTGSRALSIGLAIAVGVGQFVFAKLRGRPVDAMQWLALGLVVVFGGASLITQDNRFIMVKPSIIHAAVGIVMLRPGWMDRYLPNEARDNMPEHAALIAGYCWAALMFALAAANLVIALTLPFYVWGWYVAVVPLAAKLAAIGAQYLVMRSLVIRRIRARAATAAAAE
jgi:intracellular septation protein A